jgi:hypothetical protein
MRANQIAVALNRIGGIGVLAAMPALAAAGNSSRVVTVQLLTEQHNCYEGQPALGTKWTLQPGAQASMFLSRVQGHGCNGRQGEFTLSFAPGAANGETIQRFNFDNDGGLNRNVDYPGFYPGSLSAMEPQTRTFTYTTWRSPVQAGRAEGHWQLVCQGVCNKEITVSVTDARTNTVTDSSEIIRAVSATLEAGVQFKGIGVSGSLTSSESRRVGREMSESISHGVTNTDTEKIQFSHEEMRGLNIFSVWQWAATTTLSDNSVYVVKTARYTCTANGQTPNYLPGTEADVGACRTMSAQR